jgi:hypothetical protein
LVFHLSLDQAIAERIAHTKQAEALGNLLIIKQRLVGLIDRAFQQLSGVGAAGSSATGRGQIDALLLSGVEDGGVISSGE